MRAVGSQEGTVAATYPWDMYPQHLHVCANVVILSLLHVPATRPCYVSPQCVPNKLLSLQHVAATCPCNMTPRVCPPYDSDDPGSIHGHRDLLCFLNLKFKGLKLSWGKNLSVAKITSTVYERQTCHHGDGLLAHFCSVEFKLIRMTLCDREATWELGLLDFYIRRCRCLQITVLQWNL